MYKTKEIPIKQIKMNKNSRLVIKNEPLVDLMTSIKESGQLQDIGVYKNGAYYEAAWGARRLEAMRRLGRKTISCKVVPSGTTEEQVIIMNLVENIQRKDVSPHEQGRYFNTLKEDFKLTYTEIAARVGVSTATVAKYVQIYKELPQDLVRDLTAQTRGISRQGKLTANLANEIIELSKRTDISKPRLKKLYDLGRSGKISTENVKTVSRMLDNTNAPLSTLLDQVENFRPVTFNVVIDRKKAGALSKKEKKSFHVLVVEYLRKSSKFKDILIRAE